MSASPINIFEQASRVHLRFESSRGLLAVEDLWDLPLQSTTGKPNLDMLAQRYNHKLKDTSASFVTPSERPDTEAQLQFDIVKHIIDVRLAENKAKLDEQDRRERKQRILEIIERKKDEQLSGKSLEELQADLAAL